MKWKDENIAWLKENYHQLSTHELATYLGISHSAVIHKGQRLKMLRSRVGLGSITGEQVIQKHSCPEPNSGCWLWVGAYHATGYGQSARGGTSILAHRLSWRVYRGPIPEGLYVCHKCDIRECVNPDHLFLGTAKDNSRDMAKKGRCKIVHRRGEENNFSKLTTADVIEIRRASGFQYVIAKRYGISQACVSRIKRRETWNHIE